MTPATVTAWNGYWDSLPDGQFFFPAEGEEAARNLAAELPISNTSVVLDYGTGYGQAAAFLAPRVGRLFVCDQSDNMQRFAREHLARFPNVSEWAPGTAETFDLIWLNSVVQYMREAEFTEVLHQFAPLLKPGGAVVLSDLIPPDHPFRTDALSLLWFSLRRGYVVKAFTRTRAFARKYAEQKASAPLFQPTRDRLTELAAAAGFRTRFLARNLTHFRRRQTAVLTRAAA